MAAKKKINWLLILQGWAMLWVVIGHSFMGKPGEGPIWENALFNFAYSFHMPLFMLVSGWLFYLTRLAASDSGGGGRFWSYPAIIKDKAIRLLLPGLVFSLVALALKVAFPGEMSRQVSLSLNEILHSYLYPNDNPLRELWFIVALFWFFVLTPIWRVLLRRKWLMWSTLVVLTFLHLVQPKIDFLCIGSVCKYAIWFYLGMLLSKKEYVEKYVLNKAWLTFISGVALYVIGLFLNPFIVTMGGDYTFFRFGNNCRCIYS